MRKSKIIVLMGLINITGCVSVVRTKNYFQDKIIVYSSINQKGQQNFNANFIVYKNDSIIKVHYPYDLLNKTVLSYDTLIRDSAIWEYPVYSNVPQYSQQPYILKKEGKKIFINYSIKGKSVKRIIYSLNNKDSVEMSDANLLCSRLSFTNGTSLYTGRDTTFEFNNLKLKCWIFAEYYRSEVGFKRVLVYTEKRTLLPVIRAEQAYKDKQFTIPSGPPITFSINFLLRNDTAKYKLLTCLD